MSAREPFLLLREVEVGGSIVDVRLEGGRVVELAPALEPRAGSHVIDGRGGALLPGLHDHHLHLLSLAAALESVVCGPPAVQHEAELRGALEDAARRAAPGWVRGVGYHESVTGVLSRERIDAWVADVPVRIQHRSGAVWMLNSAAIAALGLQRAPDREGVERDSRGRPTGRLFRMDAWLRERLGAEHPPDLAAVGALLARRGVTGVTDATPDTGRGARSLVAEATRRGLLRQRVHWMGAEAEPGPSDALRRGPVKILLDDARLPSPEALAKRIAGARARNVAFHCVTRAELVVALAALGEAGALAGDRIEHASVAPPDLVAQIRDLGLTVVTQPNFVWERGDVYLEEVAPGDRPWLYRCRGFEAAGVPLGAGTDAPFGEADPWRAMRAAVERRTRCGRELGAAEAVSPERALALFTTPASAPGGEPRAVAVGIAADLCLLRVPWRIARQRLSSDQVSATIVGGEVVWRAGEESSPSRRELTPSG